MAAVVVVGWGRGVGMGSGGWVAEAAVVGGQRSQVG